MVLLVVACALMDADGRILIAQRPVGKSFSGLWEFPGGKLEEGETPEQAIVRELREEIGIEPCERCLQPFSFVSHAYAEFHLLMTLFVCRQWDGFARSKEGQAFKWVFPERFNTFNFVPADIELARELKDRFGRGRRFE